jgi:hypothetical protein
MKMEPSFNIGSISCASIYCTFTMTLLGYRLTCFHIFVLHVMEPGFFGSMANRLGLVLIKRQSLVMTDYEFWVICSNETLAFVISD